MKRVTALIAEDEPLLASALEHELLKAWPELEVVAVASDGISAVELALKLRPDVLFFDIRMPGQTGLDAAEELGESWDLAEHPFPLLVFVTAYDKYAVKAFEAHAIDYLMKPVDSERLAKTVKRLKTALEQKPDAEKTFDRLRELISAGASNATPKISVIQASMGTQIRMVQVDDIDYFEASDKYVRVMTPDHEYLIRTPLKDLLPQLDMERFLQVHRGVVVRAARIDSAHRDESGKVTISLKDRAEQLPVSRLYASRFKAM